MSNRIGILASAVIVAGSASAVWLSPHAYASQCLEDMPCWSCVDDGNRICGPSNSEGKPPGCYDDGGVLEFPWPCNAWQPRMGYRHPDGTTTFPNGDVMDDDGNVLIVGDHSHDIVPVKGHGHGHSHHYTKG